MIDLASPVGELNKIGKVLTARLKKLGIENVADLLFYYPFRYEDYSQVLTVDKLQAGMATTVKVKVDLIANKRSRFKKKVITEVLVGDHTGSIKVVWFNQPWIGKSLRPGDEIYLSGKVSGDLFEVYFNSPNYERVSDYNVNTARLVPVYPLTEGISQKQMRFLIKSVIKLADKAIDFLPATVVKNNNLINLSQALKNIHLPENFNWLKSAKVRLSFNELFLIQLWSQLLRKKTAGQKSYPIKFFEDQTKGLLKDLPFTLTNDQKKSAWSIIKDLQKTKPMNRLLEGDVGSGKTLVVALALYNVLLAKYQSAFMAPTEILAKQHYETVYKLLKKSGFKIGLLTGNWQIINDEKVSKKDFIEQVKKGEVGLIIGTHALIQKEVKFNQLALVAVDEQHRFGVAQRQILKRGGQVPHFLSLTATPIPRSLALTIYGDLDLSVIKEMPKERQRIITRVATPDKRQLAYEFILQQIKADRQVFVVCPLIDPSDKLGVKSVKEEFEKLDQEIFPDIKIGLLHGRMKATEREKTMADFADNKTKILVATSVIEVGIDISNATVMMIEGADRFGLAQLHQFRGRVGRSKHQSYCFLFSDNNSPEVIKRLKLLVDCHDGFSLAQADLKLRGMGQLYGYQQSGFDNFKMADLSDLDSIAKVKTVVEDFIKTFLKSDNDYSLDNYPLIKIELDRLNFSGHTE